eukprot:gene18507-28567_t
MNGAGEVHDGADGRKQPQWVRGRRVNQRPTGGETWPKGDVRRHPVWPPEFTLREVLAMVEKALNRPHPRLDALCFPPHEPPPTDGALPVPCPPESPDCIQPYASDESSDDSSDISWLPVSPVPCRAGKKRSARRHRERTGDKLGGNAEAEAESPRRPVVVSYENQSCFCGNSAGCTCPGGGTFEDRDGRWVRKQDTDEQLITKFQRSLPFAHVAAEVVDLFAAKTVPSIRIEGKTHPQWEPDTTAQACGDCSAVFSLIVRRHHCRGCGRVLCKHCCPVRTEGPEGWHGARLCRTCHAALRQWSRPAVNKDPIGLVRFTSNGCVTVTVPHTPPAGAKGITGRPRLPSGDC